MDTYGDMVTLLLCFFVLLYSISSVDQVKWENLVKSLNPEAAKEISQVVVDLGENEGEYDIPGGTKLEKSAEEELIDAQFDALYKELLKLKKDSGEDVQITKGDGFVFITYREKVFFNGDSWVMLPVGAETLDQFAEILRPLSGAVQQIQILGHTSQANPDRPNNITTDRSLSAMRGAVVTAYLQEKDVIDPAKLVSSAYGQWRPIAPFDTTENRAKNRRVEILITKTGEVEKNLSEYYEQVYGTSELTETESATPEPPGYEGGPTETLEADGTLSKPPESDAESENEPEISSGPVKPPESGAAETLETGSAASELAETGEESAKPPESGGEEIGPSPSQADGAAPD